jgi:hypothetical protein
MKSRLLNFLLILTLGEVQVFAYHSLFPTEVPQAVCKKQSKKKLNTWKKRERLYKGFETVAIFDVLKCSDEVSMFMSYERAMLEGMDKETAKKSMCEALADNQKELIFYMLADVREGRDLALGKDKSPWRFWLKLNDGTQVLPSNINETMWTPELSEIFGKKHSSFKVLHKITFPVSGSNENFEHARLRSEPLQMVVRSTGCEKSINWPAETRLVKREKAA